MAKTFWFYLIKGEVHILENTANCHPRVMSTLFWQIISQCKMIVNIPWLQNIYFALKGREFEIETSWLVSVGLFSHCLVFNRAGSFTIDNERQKIIQSEIVCYILEQLTHFSVPFKGHLLLWYYSYLVHMINYFSLGISVSFIAEHIKEMNRYLNICRKEYLLKCRWFREIKACCNADLLRLCSPRAENSNLLNPET